MINKRCRCNHGEPQNYICLDTAPHTHRCEGKRIPLCDPCFDECHGHCRSHR